MLTPDERLAKIKELGLQYARLQAQQLRIAREVNLLAQDPTDENRRAIVDRVYMLRKIKFALEQVDKLLAELGASATLVMPATIPEGVDPADPLLNYNDGAIVPGRSSRKRT